MLHLPETERNPFGLTLDEISECEVEAEDDPPNVPFAMALARAMERRLVIKGVKPDPWVHLFIDNYNMMRSFAFELAEALSVLRDRAEQYGVATADVAAVLVGYQQKMEQS